MALKLWQKACTSKEQFEKERKKLDMPRLESFLTKYMSPGVPLMGVTVVLFFSWLILSAMDVLFAVFLLIWLAHNVLYEISHRNTKLTARSEAAYKSWKKLDEKLALESLVRTVLAGNVSGVIDVIIITGSFFLVILISLMSLDAFIIVFGLLSSWYILAVLIQLARRSRHRIKPFRGKSFPTLPPYVDFVLSACLATIVGFSVDTYMQMHSLETVAKILLILSAILNTAALASVWLWSKRKRASDSDKKTLTR